MELLLSGKCEPYRRSCRSKPPAPPLKPPAPPLKPPTPPLKPPTPPTPGPPYRKPTPPSGCRRTPYRIKWRAVLIKNKVGFN